MENPLIPWDVLGLIVNCLSFSDLQRTAFVAKRWLAFVKRSLGPKKDVCLLWCKTSGPAKFRIASLEISLKCWCSPKGLSRTVWLTQKGDKADGSFVQVARCSGSRSNKVPGHERSLSFVISENDVVAFVGFGETEQIALISWCRLNMTRTCCGVTSDLSTQTNLSGSLFQTMCKSCGCRSSYGLPQSKLAWRKEAEEKVAAKETAALHETTSSLWTKIKSFFV